MNGKKQTAVVLLTTFLAGVVISPSVIQQVTAEEATERTTTPEQAQSSTESETTSESTTASTEVSSTDDTSAPTTTESLESSTSSTLTEESTSSGTSTTTSTTQPTAAATTSSSSRKPVHQPTKEEQAAMQHHLASQADDAEVTESYQFSVSKNQTTQEFIASIQQPAQEVAWANDLYASVMVAQAILETGSGNSQLSQAPNYNLFGIKGQYKGKGVTFATQEDNGTGSLYTIQDEFRRYPGFKESLEDYAVLLTGGLSGNNSFYQYTWKSKTNSYKDATAFLTGRYATDTQYGAKLNALIAAYELTALDGEPTKQSKEQTWTKGATSSSTSDSLSTDVSSETGHPPDSSMEARVGGAASNGTAAVEATNILEVPVQDIELWRTYDK